MTQIGADLNKYVFMCMRETNTLMERVTHMQRERERDRERQNESERYRQRQTEREADRQREKEGGREYMYVDVHIVIHLFLFYIEKGNNDNLVTNNHIMYQKPVKQHW